MGLNFGSILTNQEERTLESISRGLTKKQVAQVLGITKYSVTDTIISLKGKLEADNLKQLTRNALAMGLIGKPSNWVRGATLPPHNPFMGPPGTSSMHANAASSDATLNPGPGVGGVYKVTIVEDTNTATLYENQVFPYALPTVLMPENGALLGVGVGNTDNNKEIPTVLLISPFTLEILDEIQLSKPDSGNLAGGVYSYLDHNNNLVLVDGDGNLRWFNADYDMATDTGTINQSKPAINIGQPMVVALMPDYKGRIWFATEGGISQNNESALVGFYDPKNGDTSSNKPVYITLPAGEMVANSISSSPAGIAVATTQALYLFRSSKGGNEVKQVWRYEYENSGLRKPGQLSPGTGATPVFFGPKTGFEYIAITDNGAENNGNTPAENFNIFTTKKAGPGDSQLVATVPFLSSNNSGTENAPIAVGKSVFSPSSYGYWYPPSAETPSASTPSAAAFSGGAQRIDLVTGKGWQSKWANQTVASAALPRLSIPDEQIYTILAEYNNAGLFSGNGVQYYFGAIDPLTGTSQNLATLGTDTWDGADPAIYDLSNYNNNPLEMTGVISPNGVFYQGMAAGILSVEGPRPRYGTGITTNGYAFSNSVSFDGDGNTYSLNAIGDSIQGNKLMWNGVEFNIGSANNLSFSWANGQEINVEQGSNLNVLNIAAAAVGGKTVSADITINFTDGSTDTWSQSFSDWCDPAYNLGEAIITQQDYRATSSGGANSTTNNIYGYSYLAPAGKSIESIVLPFESNLRLLGLEMSSSSQVSINAFLNTMGIGTAPYQIPNSQGMNGKGQYYSSGEINEFGSSGSGSIDIAWAGANFDISPIPTSKKSPSSANIVKAKGQTISVPSGDFEWLYLIGAAANGTQSNQTLRLNGSNGQSTSVQQTFTDWNNGGNPPAFGSVQNESVLSWTGQLNQDGNQNGPSGSNAAFVYGYAIPLNGLDLESFTLPNNANINILGASMI